MKSVDRPCGIEERGFSMTELMVALLVTMIVMMAVFALLQKGQDSFQREPEVADMNQSARAGLQMISGDLMKAGFQTPPALAVMWDDGGGINPDQITILYADEEVPTSEPIKCGTTGGPCRTIDRSSVLNIDPETFIPPQVDVTQSYAEGMVLFAIETSDCNGDGQLGAVPFEVTKAPQLTSAGGTTTLQVIHNPGGSESGLNYPGGFNYQVHPDCALIGLFHVVQYRINPPPPTANPILERRDLGIVGGGTWTPVSNNIENLQVQYAAGTSDIFQDEPGAPLSDDPSTWITRVRLTVFGRSESRNLQGATPGVFAAEDTHMRKSFSTTMSLRNQVFAAARETDNANWN